MTGVTQAYIDQIRRERSDRQNVRRGQFVIAVGWLDLLLDAAERSLTEQSRIDEAVAEERERCAKLADTYARAAYGGSALLAKIIARAIRSPTPVTEEGE